MTKVLEIADLFCGAGGTSTGAMQAAESLGYEPRLTAVNHWPVAVQSHTSNHPSARHVCASVDSINPRHLYPDGKLDILWASPECTHHSRARGGRPMNDQSRASGHCVTRWAEALRPDVILVENVKEFMEWGPLGRRGRPLKSKKGATFKAWLGMLESLGYKVEWRILCAADYGDPTTRQRLFVQAVRGRRKLAWPSPTHFKPDAERQLESSQRWRSAREIIDWRIKGSSIFSRERPLKENTLRRIAAGLRKYGGAVLEPFIIHVTHSSGTDRRVHSINRPVPTITCANRGEMALIEPFIIGQQNASPARSVAKPLQTVVGSASMALIQPYLVELRGTEHSQLEASAKSIDEPVPTISAGGVHAGLVEPFLVEYYGTGTTRSVREPLGTVTTRPRFGLVQPEMKIDGKQYRLEILYRMLQPHELAAAQGFPSDYNFTGTKKDIIRQIGNAVPCNTARSLVTAVLSE